MARSRTGESVLSRAVRIFDAFGPGETGLRVSEIARRSGLHVATASRLIGELVAHELLARGPDRQVRIGVRMWELAQRASPTLTLREAAMPFMADLHAVMGHHVQLAVLDGTEVLFLERLSAPGAVVNYSRVAGRMALHTSSSGLVLLAYGPLELQERVIAGPLRRYTSHTVVSGARLRTVLAEIRHQGYALCAGHVHEDATGIAVPILGAGPEVVAALSLIVPNDEQAAARVPALQAAARGIGRRLAGTVTSR
jgi:DNA-binding IclR family transcriptional regulator